MSKNINVNPDHYKVAGRERQGENVVHGVEKPTSAKRADKPWTSKRAAKKR